MGLALITFIPKIICWIYGFKKTPKLHNPNKSKIALLIPARNESMCIGKLLESINNQTYDKELFDIFIVVADDNDETINIAHNMLTDADVIVERNQKCKADALDALVKHILATKGAVYDAYIIIDADCVLHPSFIEEMNNALVTEADVIIGKKLIKNWESNNKKNRTIIANLSALTYTSVDTMGNKFKSAKGYNLAICGQGLLLSKRFIDKYKSFPFKSLCEDIEVGIHAMLNGYKELYYEHALIYSEEPVVHKEYNKRRYRWLKGYFDNNKKYRKQLLNKTFREGKIAKENLFYLYDLFPIYIMIGASAAALLVYLGCAVVFAIMRSSMGIEALRFAMLMFGIIYAMIVLFNFITVMEDRKTNKMTLWEKLKVIFVGPFYTFEYVFIFFQVLRNNYKVSWDQVERIQIDE